MLELEFNPTLNESLYLHLIFGRLLFGFSLVADGRPTG